MSSEPHAMHSCKNSIRKFSCTPVKSEQAQYTCRYEDKHVNEKEWIARETIIEFQNRTWRYSDGDEPKCTIVSFDVGRDPEDE